MSKKNQINLFQFLMEVLPDSNEYDIVAAELTKPTKAIT